MPPTGRTLLVIAAPAEARAALQACGCEPSLAAHGWALHTLSQTLDMVVSGIGKANAAGAAARFGDPARYERLVSVGIAGALPGSGLELGTVVAATASVFADEGLQTETGFVDTEGLGFPLGDFTGSAVPASPETLNWLRPIADLSAPIATVSTCSGTDELADLVKVRTGAVAEAMEGAAVMLVARRLGVAGGEIRVISNTTGNRSAQRWDLRGALERLGAIIGRLA